MSDETPVWRDKGIGLAGFGHYYPRRLVRNETADEPAGNTVDAAVIGELDVQSRHVADDEETPSVMGVRAGEAALEQAELAPDGVDLLILSNWTDRQFIPEWAPEAAHLLGAHRALAFDICGACTGFVHGVQTAAALLAEHDSWRHALVVSSERFSRRVRPTSKGELVVGDAAGAAVLSKGGTAGGGLWDSLLISDGSRREVVAAHPPRGWIKSDRELVQIASESHVDLAERMLARTGTKMSEIDWVVPHPGTGQLHTAVRERLEIPEERFVTNYRRRANTGSASVPIVLSEMSRDGRLHQGDLCYTPTVGSGWYYGGLLFRV